MDMLDEGSPGLFRVLLPFLLAHHPLCSFFDHDSHELLGRRICLGCSITYPVAAVTTLALLLARIYHQFPEPLFHQSVLLLTSLILGSLQLVKYGSERSDLPFKVTIKFLLGLSVAGISVWIITLPLEWYLIAIVMIIALFLLSFISTFRLSYVNRACAGCIYHGDWDICYGFRGLNRYHFFKNTRSTKKIRELIFDKKRKRSAGIRSGPPASSGDTEPHLFDEERWVLEDNYIFPWIMRTERVISSREQLRRDPK